MTPAWDRAARGRPGPGGWARRRARPPAGRRPGRHVRELLHGPLQDAGGDGGPLAGLVILVDQAALHQRQDGGAEAGAGRGELGQCGHCGGADGGVLEDDAVVDERMYLAGSDVLGPISPKAGGSGWRAG